MAIKKNSYYVVYVEGCSSKLKVFKTKVSMNRFFKNFVDKYGSTDDGGDNWIHHVFHGKRLDLLQLVSMEIRNAGK